MGLHGSPIFLAPKKWYNNSMAQNNRNDEDILTAGQARPDEKRIRTMQEDLERAKEHVLPDLPLATPPLPQQPSRPETPVISEESPAPIELPIVGEETKPEAVPPAPPDPPQTPPLPQATESLPEEISAEDILSAVTEPPQQKETPTTGFSPEERLSYSQEESDKKTVAPSVPELPVLTPEEMLSFGEEALPQAKTGGRFSGIAQKLPMKMVAIGLGVLLVMGGLGIVGYSFFFAGGEEPPQPEPTAPTQPPITGPIGSPEEPPVPEAVLTVQDTTPLIANDQRALSSTARRVYGLQVPDRAVHRALVKLDTSTEKRYLSVSEIMEQLGAPLAPNLARYLVESESTFFVYSENGTVRIGFAVGTSVAAALRAELSSWEANAEQELASALEALGRSESAATPRFQDNTHNGTPIRFLNFPDPNLTIDYAVVESKNLFILTTSRGSMSAAIDALP